MYSAFLDGVKIKYFIKTNWFLDYVCFGSFRQSNFCRKAGPRWSPGTSEECDISQEVNQNEPHDQRDDQQWQSLDTHSPQRRISLIGEFQPSLVGKHGEPTGSLDADLVQWNYRYQQLQHAGVWWTNSLDTHRQHRRSGNA